MSHQQWDELTSFRGGESSGILVGFLLGCSLEVVELTSWDLQFLCLPAHVFRRMIGASSAAWHLLLTFGAINKHGPCVPIYSWDHQYSILATSNNT